VVEAKPQWLNQDFTATYRVSTSGIVTKVLEVTDDSMSIERIRRANGTYSWRVSSMGDEYVFADARLDLLFDDYDLNKSQFFQNTWNRTVSFKIDMDKRDVVALNGTDLGKIGYWIDANVQKHDDVTIYGASPQEFNATISDYLYGPVKTPAGDFDCWVAVFMGERKDFGITEAGVLFYDKATGILVAAMGHYFDIVQVLMGAISMWLPPDKEYENPERNYFVLESLNTSSSQPPPSSEPQFFNISEYLPYIFAGVAVAAIPTIAYVTRKHRGKPQ
jgi:hypothetical protein